MPKRREVGGHATAIEPHAPTLVIEPGVSRRLEMDPRWRAGCLAPILARWRSTGPIVSSPPARRRMAGCRTADDDRRDAVPLRRYSPIFRLPGRHQWDRLRSLGDQALWSREVLPLPSLLSASLCVAARGSV